MSTILDALRKLQRERTAESPSRDLRGSITTETPQTARRRRGGRSGWLIAALVVLLLAGGGYWLQQSGRLAGWTQGRADGADENAVATEAELAEVERELADVPAEPDVAALGEGGVAAVPAEPIQPPVAEPVEPDPVPDTPEIAAERARLEEALANARAAQEAQAAAELETARKAAQAAEAAQAAQAAQAASAAEAARLAAAPPVPPAPAAPAPAAAAPPPTTTARANAVKPAAKKPVAAPRPARDPAPRYAAAGAASTPSTAFPEVRVESIRWHPIPERRIASLQFEQQNAPEAREGDIVAGVLVYRIDPGAVELRIGSAQRVISPEP